MFSGFNSSAEFKLNVVLSADAKIPFSLVLYITCIQFS